MKLNVDALNKYISEEPLAKKVLEGYFQRGKDKQLMNVKSFWKQHVDNDVSQARDVLGQFAQFGFGKFLKTGHFKLAMPREEIKKQLGLAAVQEKIVKKTIAKSVGKAYALGRFQNGTVILKYPNGLTQSDKQEIVEFIEQLME